MSSTADPREWELRVQLAGAYRIIDFLGWSELIWTHTTVRVPGPEHHFLINSYGLRFDEVRASNLVKVDMHGNIIGDQAQEINPAGFVIHSAVHMVRPDVGCVMHTHTIAGMAIAALETGLLPISMYALGYHERVAYHDFEGPSLDLDERERLAANLGDKNVMVLRTHGLLTCGETVAQAFSGCTGWNAPARCSWRHKAPAPHWSFRRRRFAARAPISATIFWRPPGGKGTAGCRIQNLTRSCA